MGQAKNRREETRQKFIKMADGWMTPPSENETMLLRGVGKLIFENIPIAPKEQLVNSRMKPRECHANSKFLADNDPTGNSFVIVGWRLIDNVYQLHSILNQRGNVCCVTPNESSDTHIKFAADTGIKCTIMGDKYVHTKDGIEIGYGLRPDPKKTIAQAKLIKERLLSGMNPYDAIQLLI